VRPLLSLAAEMETDRNHVIPPPASVSSDEVDEGGLDLLPPPEREPGSPGEYEALEAQAEFAHVLHGGKALTGGDLPAVSVDEQDYLGLPGLLSPQQTAALLAQRDAEIRKRTATPRAVEEVPPAPGDEPEQEDAVWHTSALLRKEIHGLVGRVAAGRQLPHASVYAKLRAAVPGPPSASAPVEVLRRRRDHLLSMV
jgi:hypothetical protein